MIHILIIIIVIILLFAASLYSHCSSMKGKKRGFICFRLLILDSFLITRKCGSQLMLVKVFLRPDINRCQCSLVNSCYCMHPVLLQAFFLQGKLSLTGLICIQKAVRLLIEVTKCRIINSRGVTESHFATLHFYQIYFVDVFNPASEKTKNEAMMHYYGQNIEQNTLASQAIIVSISDAGILSAGKTLILGTLVF